MKRSIFLAAVATLAAGSALAQSSVTVYGRLNVTAERFRANNTTTYVLNNNASRIGFKGTEDLGGGMKASFLIESGFSPDTGAASATFWGRESWVGLSGDFGKVRLGNMGPTNAYFTTADYISMHNHDTGTSEDKLYDYPGRATNMIAYTSPSFGGLVIWQASQDTCTVPVSPGIGEANEMMDDLPDRECFVGGWVPISGQFGRT